MMYNSEYLLDLFQAIKYRNRKLSTDEILDFINIVKSKYTGDLNSPFIPALLCLSYGSDYIEKNEPLLFKDILKQNLAPYDLGEVFDCIGMSGLYELYLDDIIEYSKYVNIDFDDFEPSANAITVLGTYIYNNKDNNMYSFLLQQLRDLLINLQEEKERDNSFNEDDYIFFIKRYLSSIYFSLEGEKSYTRKALNKEDLLNFDIDAIPKEIS